MKTAVYLENVANPAAPYSPGIVAKGFLFVSGQVGRSNGVLLDGITAQTQACMENLKAIVDAAGSAMDNVVKCTVFLTDMANAPAMNQVYQTFFSGEYPARVCVQVGLPEGILVEIECIAVWP